MINDTFEPSLPIMLNISHARETCNDKLWMFIKETYPINIYDRLSIIIEDDLIAI